jgi:Zn-dependent M28 family amino/carboxypeptidase
MTSAICRALALSLAVAAVSCSQPAPETTKSEASPPPTIEAGAILEHIKVLASDEYEGRAPGSKGETLTVAYLESQFKAMGLAPGNTDGTYVQEVPLVGIAPDPGMQLVLTRQGRRSVLKYADDFVAWTKRVTETVGLQDSELVFVGYGVEAPEYQWNDYKGVDLRGKTLVMLVNDPPVPDQANASALDPRVFGGRAMTYYGRWTYKFEMAAQKGAAGALIVHETEPAGYPWPVVQGNMGEKFDLVTPDRNMGRAAVEGWITLDQARTLVSAAGLDFDALKQQAVSRDFKPVPLGTTATLAIRNKLREVQSKNVLAKLPGGDPAVRDEYVVFGAHWDHLGVGTPVNGDAIYNGAADNASGVAGMLEIARAITRLASPPRRSILFLAVTAEEQGLLGSQYYAGVQPVYPVNRTLANINIDVLNLWGRTRDFTIVGLGNSDLDDYAAQAAAEQGRVIKPDAEPEKGFYYRSDHFNFAKVGVPALDPDSGTDYVGKPPGYGETKRREFTNNDYHKPSDELRPDWDLSGAIDDLHLLMTVGYRVAQAERYPEWKPGTEFRAIREQSLKQ